MGGKAKYSQFPIRIDSVLIDKIKIIGAENGRSANKEIERLIKKHIREYEAENGELTEDDIKGFQDTYLS